MHTVRNRTASRPPSYLPAHAENLPPAQRSSRQELARLLRSGAPSEASATNPVLALPAIPLTAAAWPGPVLPVDWSGSGEAAANGAVPDRGTSTAERPQTRRNPKGKKARKAAARKAALATAAPKRADKRGPERSRDRHVSLAVTAQESAFASPAAASPAASIAAPAVHSVTPPAFGCEVMLALCLQAEPALALTLPSRPEPLVEAPEPEMELANRAEIPTESEPTLARVLSLAEMPELLVPAPMPMPMPMPPFPVAEPVSARPAAALAALAALVEVPAAPLPRSRALVPARRQGLVDVIAFLLRDSGRRLARWSARRHKSRAERDLLRRAEARQHALISELEALDTLRRNRG